jgi:D-glycero-D-manno-heptose 1,7-bisphosphate phosphatase
MRPAVFVDRDGTLMEEVEYCRDPEKVRVLPGVKEGLARLRESGFQVVMITNQSGIGRGLIKLAEYRAVQKRLLKLLGRGAVQAVYFCPETPETATARRKPGPGMVLEAAQDFALDLGRSWFIGDKRSDVECALAAGVRPILVRTGYGAGESAEGAEVAEDFEAAVGLVLAGAWEHG